MQVQATVLYHSFCRVAKKDKLSSVADISKEADVSRQRILQIIEAGNLKAEKVGGNYIIRQSYFETWSSSRRDAGRPKKEAKKQK